MILGFGIPFLPQVMNNYQSFSQFQPLIVRGLYQEQLTWGIQYLKYISVVVSGAVAGMGYANPFAAASPTSFTDFLLTHPLEFFATQGLHLFALFDHDYAFPYLTQALDAWYRVPLTVVNAIFLFSALFGVGVWLPRVRQPQMFSRLDLALAGWLLGVLVYLPGYIPAAVEPRFSLPLYLLISPFAALTWEQVRMRQHIIPLGLGLVFFLAANLGVYAWLHSSVPLLDLATNQPVSFSRYAWTASQIRWDDHLALIEFGVEPERALTGGDAWSVALKWQCANRSPAASTVHIDLVDTQDRIWARMVRDPHYTSPCANRPWGATQVSQVILLRLPVTMPAGKYHLRASVLEHATNTYVPGYRMTGEPSGEHASLATVPIEKNKRSFTAGEIFIPHPFFVDLAEMRLLGYADLPAQVRAGDALDVGLYWRARGKPQGDYSITVQLRDAAGNVVVEQTARPAENTYPTTEWNEGEVLLDWHTLDLPSNILEGEYSLVAILRDTARDKIIGAAQFTKISVAR